MKTFDFNINDLNKMGKRDFSPDNYILNEELSAAVKVAIATRQPLLLTGEPGTGKTQLAFKIAQELSKQSSSFLPQPLVFNTKTTSTAQDLFYMYNALRHFHDANIKKVEGREAPDATAYIHLQALGKAIALTNPQELASKRFVSGEAKSAVVLIDEIDKAPRDFTNDILAEIENYSFEIKELPSKNKIERNKEQAIIVIMTSNSEKNLPEPFLRRCVFYHIPFPSEAQLLEIVKNQFGEGNEAAYQSLIQHFIKIRNASVRKPPATAELMAWLHILEISHFFEGNQAIDFNKLTAQQGQVLKYSYSVLVKTREDLAAIEKMYK